MCATNSVRRGAVIMADSSMCTGGRVRHDLQHHLGWANSSVASVGYAAVETLVLSIVAGPNR
jgi:metallo-beta-lactamase family protein